MPINIYKEETIELIAFLCKDDWKLPSQIYELEKWVQEKGYKLPKGKYIADIGFNIRKDATGGGAVLNIKTMKILADIGITLFFSEYPDNNQKN